MSVRDAQDATDSAENIAQAGKRKSDMKTVVDAVGKTSWNRGEVLLHSFAINVFGIALPIFILQVYDRVLPQGALNSLYVMASGLFVVIIFDMVIKLARNQVISWNGTQFEHLARLAAVKRILNCPLERFESESSSTHLERVNAITTVKDFYSAQIATLIIDLPFALMFLALIWLLGGSLVIVPIVLLLAFSLLATRVGLRMRDAVRSRISSDDKRYDFLIEALKGIQTVKAMNLKPVLLKRFEELQKDTAYSVHEVAKESARAQALGSLFSQMSIISVIAYGAVLVVNGELTGGQLAACMLLSGRALAPLQSAMGIWTNYQSVKVAAKSAAEVLTLPSESPIDLPQIPEIQGYLEIKNLNFAYGNAPDPFIKDLNLKVSPGEIISIEGLNSSGRTTLLLLILGMLKPQSGEILLDGNSIFDYNLSSVRGEISMISNNAPLYSGNLIENMTGYQQGDIIFSALDLAAELGLDEEIKTLPEGYDTRVGGSTIDSVSGGVRQRITTVRALVDDPKIILFDEGNMALDTQSNKLLLALLAKRKPTSTMILVTHNPDYINLADRHYAMVEGVLSLKEKQPQDLETEIQFSEPNEPVESEAVEIPEAIDEPVVKVVAKEQFAWRTVP